MQQEIRFGPMVLDRLHCELRGPARKIRIDQKACDVLTLLIECRDRAVPREEILERVWPGVIVSPSSVAVQVHAIRDAFKKAGCGDEPIRTLKAPARYQFCFGVDEEPLPATPDTATTSAQPRPRPDLWRRLRFAAGVAMMVASGCAAAAFVLWHGSSAPPLSILVKPFRNLSADAEKAYLADAITDDLTIDLGHIPFSTVIARSTAEAVKDKTAPQIGKLLNVRYVLEGSIAPEDEEYHVTASLVDTQNGVELWTANFDRPRSRLSELRQDIVSKVRSPLNVRLLDIASDRSLLESPANPGALDWYLRARSILDHQHDLQSFQQAQDMMEKARAIEPDSPQVNAELGWMLLRKVTSLDDPDDKKDRDLAQTVINQALRLSPANERAVAAKAFLMEIGGDCAGAGATATRLLDTYPNYLDARSILAMCAVDSANPAAAVEQYKSLITLDPDSSTAEWRRLPLGTSLLVQGKAPEAEAELRQCLEPAKSGTDMDVAEQCAFMHISALFEAGHEDGAIKEYRDYARKFPFRTVWRLSGYFPESWQKLPGFVHLLDGLRGAGMPIYAKEDDAVADPPSACGRSDFAATPLAAPTIETFHTGDVQSALLRQPAPLLVDVGRGRTALSPLQQTYRPFDVNEEPEQFAVRVARQKIGTDPARLVIVFGDGPSGCAGLEAALAVHKAGFAHVAWYRGGEEVWQSLHSGSATPSIATK